VIFFFRELRKKVIWIYGLSLEIWSDLPLLINLLGKYLCANKELGVLKVVSFQRHISLHMQR
jgi:hypothetical protein